MKCKSNKITVAEEWGKNHSWRAKIKAPVIYSWCYVNFIAVHTNLCIWNNLKIFTAVLFKWSFFPHKFLKKSIFLFSLFYSSFNQQTIRCEKYRPQILTETSILIFSANQWFRKLVQNNKTCMVILCDAWWSWKSLKIKNVIIFCVKYHFLLTSYEILNHIRYYLPLVFWRKFISEPK